MCDWHLLGDDLQLQLACWSLVYFQPPFPNLQSYYDLFDV